MSRAAKPAGPFAPGAAPARWQRALASACLMIFLAAFGSIFAVAALRGRLGVSGKQHGAVRPLGRGLFLPGALLACRAFPAFLPGLGRGVLGRLGLLLALQLGSGFLC